ncbi:MAG: hypothetical protein A2X12_08165 [Bacteroidetes bacterium GWE2_29_8]|nr:MAG: hypothetical protein A2X12_08165 [Bacteroidetes bacterium GWE2_29_8]OFY18954.1 MAG: hypothetical protein A2X02_04100 [Bacteroidetes bacterium GWF2_29_10]
MKIKKLLIKKIDLRNSINDDIETPHIDDFETNISEQYYDENQNLLKEITFDSYGDKLDVYEYEYDDKNRLVNSKLYIEEQLSEEKKYEYDANNNRVKKIRIFESGISDYTIYNYNEKNLLIKKITYYDDGEIESTQDFVYDDNMNLINSFIYDEDNKVQYELKNKYENNLLKEYLVNDFPNKDYKKTICSYYDNGLKQNEFVFNYKEKLIYKTTYQYDNNNNNTILIEETQDTYSKIVQEYDNKRLISKKEFDKDNICLNSQVRNYDNYGILLFTIYENLVMPQNIISSYKVINIYEFYN